MATPLQVVPPTAFAPRPRASSVADLIEQERHRARVRRLTWVAVAAAVIGASVALYFLLRPKPVPLTARFRSQAASTGPVVHEVTATGHLEAESAVSVGAEISGRIATVEVDYNSKVTAGQVLARFDKGVLEAQVAQARALVAAVKAQASQARFDEEQARRMLSRAASLYSQKSLSEQEHEAAITTAKLAQARLEATRAQVAAQEAAMAVALSNLAHAEVRAPNDGVVITRNVEPGQTVASMLQAPVLFTLAADLKHMRVVAAVDEADIGDVIIGQKATFTVNAWPTRVFEGRVTEVRNSAMTVQDVVSYGVVITVGNETLELRPGMTASVRIITATVPAADRVPNAALYFTPPGEKREPGEGAIFVLDQNQVRKIAVAPGITDGELTALAPGVSLAGYPVLVDLTPQGRRAYGIEPKR